MKIRHTWRHFETQTLLSVALLGGASLSAQTAPFQAAVPRTWDDEAMAALEVPLANPIGSPKQVQAEYYYKIPVRRIYKLYPVYAPGREPAGYMTWLKKQEPVLLWDDAGQKPPLKTEADWIKAGETVFSAPIFSEGGDDGVIALTDIRNTDWYEKGGVPLTKEGMIPFVHYVVREKGKIELGSFSCAMCHTRVMSDGSMIKGAQGNFPFERASKYSPRPQPPPPLLHLFIQALYGTPWLNPDPLQLENDMSPQEILELMQTIPPGVLSRQSRLSNEGHGFVPQALEEGV